LFFSFHFVFRFPARFIIYPIKGSSCLFSPSASLNIKKDTKKQFFAFDVISVFSGWRLNQYYRSPNGLLRCVLHNLFSNPGPLRDLKFLIQNIS